MPPKKKTAAAISKRSRVIGFSKAEKREGGINSWAVPKRLAGSANEIACDPTLIRGSLVDTGMRERVFMSFYSLARPDGPCRKACFSCGNMARSIRGTTQIRRA